MDTPPEWADFTIAVMERTNNKSTGLNNPLPNSFKEMTPEKLLHLLDFIIGFWEDRLDFTKCH